MADETDDDVVKKHRDLLIACGWGKEVDVILLIQQGASVRVQDQDGKNCLHYSACKGHIQVTNLLIENGCAINARDKRNRTPLHVAAEEGHNDIVSILLDNNAEFNVEDDDGYTPCHVACVNDHTEVLELLIHIKANLIVKSKDGYTPLHLAAMNSNVKSMSLLIKAGVLTSPQDSQGNTPLHLAVQGKFLKSLKCLIKNDTNVNIQNHDGDTALHLCADLGYVQFAEYILNSEQPVELSSNNAGDTAKDIAISHGFRELVQIIPDPFRKRKSKRRSKNLDSPSKTLVSSKSSNNSSVEQKEAVTSQPREPKSLLRVDEDHTPIATVSFDSLWVPTTDSGISLPMDNKAEPAPPSGSSTLPRRKHKNIDKSLIVAELQLRHRKSEKIRTHEYAELRNDPRFVATKTSPTNEYNSPNHSKTFQNGSLSEDSVQHAGCFFKSKPKNMRCRRKRSLEHEKELMQKQAELHYQLNESKVSLEKQMRKIRKKFEKALLATDNRFVEQKKREEAFHNQLRGELEIIERSLERGSKKNVEEFTQHIKGELNKLTEKLTGGVDVTNNYEDIKSSSITPTVDSERHVTTSLPSMDVKHCASPRVRIKHDDNSRVRIMHDDNLKSKQSSAGAAYLNEERMRRQYEQRLKDLEVEMKQNAKKERENEELRARVVELERMLKTERGNDGVT